MNLTMINMVDYIVSRLKILLVLLVPFQVSAQVDSVPNLCNANDKITAVPEASGTLYAHFDKNIYSINEMVWFTAYLISDEQQKEIADFMQVLLVDDQRQIVLNQKIFMERGIASGNILLPDSLRSGRYKFILYANTLLDGIPQHLFTQPVIIKGSAAANPSGRVGSSKPPEVINLRQQKKIYEPAPVTLSIGTNDSIYKIRQKVQLTLKLSDWQGTPLPGNISVSCVQSNRLSALMTKDIETYSLWHPLAKYNVKEITVLQDVNNLKKLSLNTEWKNESWIKLMKNVQPDKSFKTGRLDISGKVTRSGKRLKKPVTLILMKDGSLSVIPTDSAGHFLLTTAHLLQTSRKDLHLMVSGKFPQDYEISIEDPYEKISKSLAVHISGQEQWDTTVPQDIDLGISASPRMNQLKEVKIVSKRDMTFFGTRKTENSCGDYVCQYGYLNCPTHVSDPGNKAPVKGIGYKLYMGLNANGEETFSTQIYSGCEVREYEYSKVISAIFKTEAFVPQNFDTANSSIPELSSTLLWISNFEVSSSGIAQLNFYTNDLKGRFKIVVQGLVGDHVVTAEKIITVQ